MPLKANRTKILAQKQIHYKQNVLNISYEIVNPTAKHDIIILHGWGSNKELMRDAFKNYLPSFRHIYIDLPGFGNSTFANVMTTHNYREIIATFLEDISAKRDIIMGHSFGGKIATLLNPDLLVLLSSAGIQESKPLDVWMKIYTFKFFKFLGLAKLRNMFVANDGKNLEPMMYETFKNVVNEDFRPYFTQFSKKALVAWGDEDTATSKTSGEIIASLIPDAQFSLYDGDHYFFMYHASEITQEIEQMYITR